MSKLLNSLRRVGTQAKKFQFTLTVVGIKLSKSFGEVVPEFKAEDSTIAFVWSRGPRSATSKPVGIKSASDKEVGWDDQPQTLMCTLYEDTKKKELQAKKSKIVIKLVPKGSESFMSSGSDIKVFGQIEFNLAKYAGEDKEEEDMLVLEKCKDKEAKIFIRIRSRWLKGLDGDDDAMSVLDRDGSEEDISVRDSARSTVTREETKESPVSPAAMSVSSATPAATSAVPAEGTPAASSAVAPSPSTESAPAPAPAPAAPADAVVSPAPSVATALKVPKSVGLTVGGSASELNRLRTENEALNTKLSVIMAERDELKKTKEKLEKSGKDLQKKLSKRDEEAAVLPGLKAEKEAAVYRAEKLQDQVKELLQKVKDLEKKGGFDVAELEHQRMDYMDKYEKEKKAHLATEELVAKLKSEISHALDEKKSLEQDKAELNEKIVELENEVKTVESYLVSTKTEVSEARAETERVRGSIHEFEEKLAKLEETKAKLEKAKEKAAREVEKLQGFIGEMEVKMVTVKVDLVNSVDKMNALEMENMKLKTQLDALQPKKKK